MSTDEPVAGLKAIFLENRAMLQRLLAARLPNREDAEDALQDIWLKLDSLDARPVAQPLAYLCRMAMNQASDRRVSAMREGRRDTAWLDIQPLAGEFADAERQLVGRDSLRRLEAMMAAMPDRMQLALRLFRVDELPQRDIAERLGISISGVEKLLRRAHRQIHDNLDSVVADVRDQDRL